MKALEGHNLLLTLTERKTREYIIIPLKAKTSEEVDKAINRLRNQYKPVFKALFKSITSYNDSEFLNLSNHGIDIYYAHPYSAWEWGTNERHNGLIRRFIHKAKAIKEYTADQIKKVQNWCNHYPRKILGYKPRKNYFRIEVIELLKPKSI